MKANFKKASVFALAMALVLLMSLSVIPMVSAEEAAATTGTYYEIEQNYTKDFKETIGAMNISLDGKINLKLYYEGIGDSHDYIKVWLPGKDTYTTYQKEDLEFVDGRYLVEVPVNAAQQTELVKFQWVDTNGADGKWRSYSVRYYAGKIMDLAAGEEPTEEVQKMDHTVKSMLNYGAMAQLRFNYKTDNLANEGLFDNSNPVDNMLVDHLYDATSNPAVDEFFLGTNVSLEDDIRMKVYVNAPVGTEVTINNSDKKTSVRKDANGTYVGIYNIPANQFADQFEIAVDGYDTIYYSILGWCKSVLESYRTTEEEKNIAKALYQYYTWTTNYADDTYVPGPKDDNGATACTHERYYVKGENVVCSDCGENISATTRVSLTPSAPSFIIDAENGTEVTFILSVVGSVDLKALSVTPVAEGLTLEATSIEVLEPHTQNVNGTAALNILLDAETAITENTQLAQITYNVKAADAGSYKITLTVNEALNDAEADVSEFIVPVTTILEAINPDCPHETKTGYDVTDAGHRWYCDICKQTGAWEDHTKANVWTPVLEEAGGKVTGELYETRNCTVCAAAMEQRAVYYQNSIDSFKVNGTIVNPSASNAGQSAGIQGAPASGYNTFVVSPENFIGKDGTALVLKDTGTIGTGGWIGVNGGVARCVIKINNGKWQNYNSGSCGPVTAESGIGKAIVNNGNITDKDGSLNGASYQGGLTFSDLEAYANQTITVTLGVVPANNPGTEENPNVLITAVIENLFVECTHLGQNVASVEATDVPTIFNATCVCGESYATTDVNDEGLKMFNADEILTRTTGHNAAYSVTKMTEGDLDFVRFELLADKTTGSEYLWYFIDGSTPTAPKLSYGASDTFMMIYRANEKYPSPLTIFANQTAYKSMTKPIAADGEWHVAAINISSIFDAALGDVNAMRFDIFDDYNIEAGATIDIAYMGFFKDANHAMANYKTAIDKYEFDKANFLVSMDVFKVDGNGFDAANGIRNPDNMTVISNGGTEYKAIEIDLAGTPITTIDKSLNYRGWVVTPSGAAGIAYRIIDAEGNASELREYVVPGSIGATNGIATTTTKEMYGDGRLSGAAFQSTANTFDLSGYAGETVTVEVIVVNNWGQTATIMKIYNVAVVACSNHVLVDVPAKASTCATPGNEAYKTCETCGRIYDMSEVELNAIPTLPLDENAHNKVNKPWTAPTTKEYGWEAHISCANCNKAWDADDNLIAVPTIAKIVPTTNKYWGYEDMKGWVASGNVDTKPSEDRSFVRFERNTTTSDQYLNFLMSNTAVTGQYLVFKYRTSSETYVQVWANTLANGHDGGKANASVSTIADGEWHIAVVDLSTLLPNYVQPNANEEYAVQWARIDMLDVSRAAGTYFDFGFIALTDDPSKVGSILLDGDEDYCSHYVADDAVWTLDPNDPLFEKTDCLICGGKVERYISTTSAGLHIFTPDVMVDKTGAGVKPTLMFSENGMPYINVTAAKTSGEETTHLFSNMANPIPGSKLGKYVGVLYRTDHNEQIQVVLEGKLGSVQASVKNLSNANTNGAWKFEFVDVSTPFSGTLSSGEAYGYDGSQLTAFRIDYFNNARKIGDTVDIAFVAFFNTPAEAYAYYAQYVKAYDINCEHFTTTTVYDSNTQLITTTCDACGEVTATKACDHSKITTAWDSAQKIYTFTCDYCGNVETSDMLYKTEANTAGDAGSSSHFLTISQEDGFVRYTPSKSASDPYFYPFSTDGTQVTGQFMVIKYRVTNNGTNMTTSAPFAGSLAGGATGAAGSNGDSSNIWATSTTLYADGEWHYLIVTPDLTKNLVFTPEADGTYHWRWFRMRLNSFAAFDGSCYFDIDEIAFADTAEAASYYVYKNDTTRKNFHYTFNLDVGNNKLNGEEYLPKAQQKQTTIAIDMSEYAALQTPTSLTIGGWTCVTGGVASYKVRVTSVDGVAVENPTLVDWHGGGNRADIYNAYGKTNAFNADCQLGAGMGGTGGTIVDLTAYAGHTVEFEIVAITRFGGEELVAVKYTNVVVPEVAAAE